MSLKNVMNMDEARKIWPGLSDEDLKKWLELKNKIIPDLDGHVPKGATIEIDEETGKAVPCDKY
jgi:hypothetical protein